MCRYHPNLIPSAVFVHSKPITAYLSLCFLFLEMCQSEPELAVPQCMCYWCTELPLTSGVFVVGSSLWLLAADGNTLWQLFTSNGVSCLSQHSQQIYSSFLRSWTDTFSNVFYGFIMRFKVKQVSRTPPLTWKLVSSMVFIKRAISHLQRSTAAFQHFIKVHSSVLVTSHSVC